MLLPITSSYCASAFVMRAGTTTLCPIWQLHLQKINHKSQANVSLCITRLMRHTLQCRAAASHADAGMADGRHHIEAARATGGLVGGSDALFPASFQRPINPTEECEEQSWRRQVHGWLSRLKKRETWQRQIQRLDREGLKCGSVWPPGKLTKPLRHILQRHVIRVRVYECNDQAPEMLEGSSTAGKSAQIRLWLNLWITKDEVGVCGN